MTERTIRQAFDQMLSNYTPSTSERNAAAAHRASAKAALDPLDIYGLWETGSFHHGTAVRGHADVDVLVSLKGEQPLNSDTALNRVKAALVARFPSTPIRISRPAVVVNFAGGSERWEVIPAYIKRIDGDTAVYSIPAPGGNWMETAPSAHLRYVTDENTSPAGGAKGLARLMKIWKYTNQSSVKVSSFYLEMRAARRMSAEVAFVPHLDFLYLMRDLNTSSLAAMNDPSGVTGRIPSTSTDAYRAAALATLRGDLKRTDDAVALGTAGKGSEAFAKLSLVFPGAFPAQYY
jgi:hypothetical protein